MNSHSEEISLVLQQLETTENGLSESEASRRLEQNGKNALSEGKSDSKIKKFFKQFTDPMIIVLIVAAIVSAVISLVKQDYVELWDGGLILLIVVVNAVIGFVQENKAEQALAALKNMNKPYAKVIRDGEIKHIKSEDLVVGDIVVMEAGDIVPADIRLIETVSFKVEQAALTGESVPVETDASVIVDENTPLGDRKNMAYSSGVVAYGRGKGVVVAVGMDTEVGKIARMLMDTEPVKTPLQQQLAKTAKVLTYLVMVIAVIIFAAGIIRHLGTSGTGNVIDVILESFMVAVAIAVAAIPEGLPAVVTIVLAIGVQTMSKRNAIVRNLPAVETLGCCEIICSDKTGTITLNQMTVKKLYTMTDGLVADDVTEYSEDMRLLARGLALCNDTKLSNDGKLLGDPTETALVAYLMGTGVDFSTFSEENKRVDEIPFDSVRKLMTTVNEHNGERMAYIKGAPDMLLNRCDRILVNGQIRPITDEDVNAVLNNNSARANQALRVLGMAVRYDDLSNIDELESKLIFVGLVGMIDPPRKEVVEAVKVCFEAGLRPIMITGDHKDTAAAIAREVGILRDGDKVMLGTEIDTYSDAEFAEIIQQYSVFARVSPENKVKIVKAYKSLSKIVAMTGDGVNDAPSIKESDIGIGMGITGTDVSKGASDMVLADDNFATIVGAIEEGRKIYKNIVKAIQYLLSANIAEVLCLFIVTIFLRDKEFLTPVMILWVNLVTDALPALALGMERSEKDIMKEKPRKVNSSLLRGKTGEDILIQGAMQTALTMTSFCVGTYVFGDNGVGTTMAFLTLCFIQLFHSFNLHSQDNTIFDNNLFKNRMLNLSFLVGGFLAAIVILVPVFRIPFSAVALNGWQWLTAIGCSMLIVPLVEIQKLIERFDRRKLGKK